MAGERNRFLADALHEIAVGREHKGCVINEFGAEGRGEMAFRDRHADSIGETLAERAGRRLDAWRVAVLGMAWRQRAKLAKTLDLLDGDFFIAEEIKERVEQHRAVAGGEHETIAVGPGR